MRQMMEYAFSESDRLGLPLILTTDDEKKVKIYEHFGMKKNLYLSRVEDLEKSGFIELLKERMIRICYGDIEI